MRASQSNKLDIRNLLMDLKNNHGQKVQLTDSEANNQ